MKFTSIPKTFKSSLFNRNLYQAIRSVDSSGFGRKRRQLEKQSQNILKKKEVIIKKTHAIESQERAYRADKKNYEAMVKTVTSKLSYKETLPLTDRKKKLEAFCIEASSSNSQDSLEM